MLAHPQRQGQTARYFVPLASDTAGLQAQQGFAQRKIISEVRHLCGHVNAEELADLHLVKLGIFLTN